MFLEFGCLSKDRTPLWIAARVLRAFKGPLAAQHETGTYNLKGPGLDAGSVTGSDPAPMVALNASTVVVACYFPSTEKASSTLPGAPPQEP